MTSSGSRPFVGGRPDGIHHDKPAGSLADLNYWRRARSSASQAARCVACQGVRSHAVPVALMGVIPRVGQERHGPVVIMNTISTEKTLLLMIDHFMDSCHLRR